LSEEILVIAKVTAYDRKVRDFKHLLAITNAPLGRVMVNELSGLGFPVASLPLINAWTLR